MMEFVIQKKHLDAAMKQVLFGRTVKFAENLFIVLGKHRGGRWWQQAPESSKSGCQ